MLGPPPEVERSEHGDIYAEAGEHKLDAAEHERRERSAGQVSDEVDDENLLHANDADDDTSICC